MPKYLSPAIGFLCCFCISTLALFAEESVRGRVVNPFGEPVQAATIRLVSARDTTMVKGAITDRKGQFSIDNVASGPYRLRVNMVGYAPLTMTTFVRNSTVDVGDLKLSLDTVQLRRVQVEADALPVQMKGDTTEFNAKAFKTNEYATSEELVKKMPGITVEDGTVKAQGEEVRRVLVDGKRFFGDDARQTLQNVPADMVEGVQVYDARSNQSMFSGFDDGGTEKTINLVTKKDKRKGAFGNAYGGYGTDERFSAGATYNAFNGPQRLTMLGLTNNINQQNFNLQDLLGSMGIGGGQARMMGAMASRVGAGNVMSRMGGSAANLFVGQQDGITTTHALGTQYSDTWWETFDVSGSYFFNYADNNNGSYTDRQYVEPVGQTYTEDNHSRTIGRNHRFTFRMESQLDSVNRLLIEPRLSYQGRSANTGLDGEFALNGSPLSRTVTNTFNDPAAINLGGSVNYSHRMNTEGRTVSVEASVDWRKTSADGTLNSLNAFSDGEDTTSLNQINSNQQNGTTLRGEIGITEPLGNAGQLRLSYNPSITIDNSDRSTFEYDQRTGEYSIPLPLLTNVYNNTYSTQAADVQYRVKLNNTIISAGLGYQYSVLEGNITSPQSGNIRRTFNNVLPTLMLRQRFSQQSELTLRYQQRTQAPSITQLQNVIDNSNPLQLSTGNPELDQSLTHNIMLRFRDVNWMVGRTFFGFVSASLMEDYVGTSTAVTLTDTTIGGVPLPRGATITIPMNLSGFMRVNSFFTYGWQANIIKSNVNLNGGVNYVRTPSMVNMQDNFNNSTNIRLGTYISSNFSEDLDIGAGYDAQYNIIINSLTREQDANYFSHTATGRVIWNIGPLACSTDVAHTMFSGLGQGFDQSFTVWNAGLGWRILDRAGEIRLSVFDLLGQNASVNRTVNPVSIDNTQTQVITRYAMLTFSYQLRNFSGAAPPPSGRPRFRPD